MTEMDSSEAKSGFPMYDEELTDKGFKEMEAFALWLQDVPTQTIWFRNLLIALFEGLLREYRSLSVGVKKSPPLLAWACRNMLELNVIAKYVLLSESNAKEFVDDWIIDDLEVFESFRSWMKFHGATTVEIDKIIVNFQALKQDQGVTRKKYLRTKDMAGTVNFSEEYEHVNKVTSKMVHPTAFSVLAPGGKYGVLTPILFNNGVRFGVEAYAAIKKHVSVHGVVPTP